MKKDDTQTLTFRLDPELKAAVKKMAEREQRSINNWFKRYALPEFERIVSEAEKRQPDVVLRKRRKT